MRFIAASLFPVAAVTSGAQQSVHAVVLAHVNETPVQVFVPAHVNETPGSGD